MLNMAMDLLYRWGGLKGPEIGKLFGLSYSAVSRERKKLRDRIMQNDQLLAVMKKVEKELSINGI
jgi:REP-associated tyrosine transposase